MTTILDGQTVRDERKKELRARFEGLSVMSRLVIIRVDDREDTSVYVAQKQKMGASLGVSVDVKSFATDVVENELLHAIDECNNAPEVNGIIVQLPLPKHINLFRIIEAVDPKKDVDGLTAVNLKKLFIGDDTGYVPATARGIFNLLQAYNIDCAGMYAVVVGRSMLVGTPTARLLLNHDATVTIVHSKTTNLPAVTREADILVVAAGTPGLITREHVRNGQVVVDVGMNCNKNRHINEGVVGNMFVGDVSYDKVVTIVSALSPVPGGVGPMTVLTLFENLYEATARQSE